ncbi:MAG: hypothetical protein K2K63_00590 [Acetatifactor sp.]|nr:hypothetical protein [Acetatifactor sp.]
MNLKKRTFALAAILAVSLAITGCGSPETKTKDSDESSTVESQNTTEKSNPSESSDSALTDSETPESSSESGASQANYEPFTIDCSEVLSSGDTRYFELTYTYGDACTVTQRYIYENGSYNGGVIKVAPGTETDLAAIINNADVLAGGSPSIFTEVTDGWTMNLEASQEEEEYMNSFTIEELRTFFWGVALMSEGYSQEEAEAIIGVSGEPQMPYIIDDPSDSLQSGITLDDVSYTLFGADGTMILFGAYYADEFTIEEKFLFDSNGDFESLEITLTTGSVSDTDEIFATLKSLYGDEFNPDDYTLTEQSAEKYAMCDSVPTRSFFFGSDLASMSGVTYSVVYSVLSDSL